MHTFGYIPLLFVRGIIEDRINVPFLDQGILGNLKLPPSVPEAGTLKSLRSNNGGGFRSMIRMTRDSGHRRSMRKMPLTEDKNNMKATINFEDEAKNNLEEHRLFSAVFMRV